MMKKILHLSLFLALITSVGAIGQSTKIMDENFQDWDASPDTDPTDCESGLEHESELVQTITVVTSDGGEQIDVNMIHCGIAPECGSKRQSKGGENGEGITDGYVSLSKAETEQDTIGEMVFGPIPHIDSVRFGHSATGDNRGIRIYKSTDDGETWERATDNEFNESEDSQAGDLRTVEINEENVYIKFTSGIDLDGDISQHSRLHNLEAWGEPGELAVGINDVNYNVLSVRSMGNGTFSIEGTYNHVKVYNTAGKIVHANVDNASNIIDLNGLSDGIYIIRAEDETGAVFTGKIMKQ